METSAFLLCFMELYQHLYVGAENNYGKSLDPDMNTEPLNNEKAESNVHSKNPRNDLLIRIP
jgi:hypothetical protein